MAKFDLSKTQQVDNLLKVPCEERDKGWRDPFFAAIVDASMATTPQQVIQGPDAFPYFVLNLPPAGQPFETFCISHILDVCLENGLGVVIQPDANPPQWVFSYGNLWSLKEFGKFEVEPPAKRGAENSNGTTITAGPAEDANGARSVFVGQPSAGFFPAYARKVIKRFLAGKGGEVDPKVLLVNDPQNSPAQSLVFSIFAEDFPNRADFEDLMYRLTWLLPRHYGLVSIAKDSELAKWFEPV